MRMGCFDKTRFNLDEEEKRKMASLEWKQEILKQLNVRDTFEKKDSEVFAAFQELLGKLKQPKVETEEESKVDDKLIERLNASATQIDKLELLQLNQEKTITNLTKTIGKTSLKVENLTLELNEKNKTIEIINDELLMLQMQNNLLNQKVTELSLENDSLIQRWMNKVSQDAEKLNDANQFLQSLER